MSYATGTILSRKEPFEEPADDSPDLRPYNEIKVIGPSPVQTNARAAEWTGQAGDNISVIPTDFGEVIDRPQGELQKDYDVTFIPESNQPLTHTVTVQELGPSPEETFSAVEAEEGLKQSEEREETPFA
jgi:hypothetical protein